MCAICKLFQLIKVDIKTHTKITWCMENVYPSEPIFVPSPDAKVGHCIFAVIATYFYNSCLIRKCVQILFLIEDFFHCLGARKRMME